MGGAFHIDEEMSTDDAMHNEEVSQRIVWTTPTAGIPKHARGGRRTGGMVVSRRMPEKVEQSTTAATAVVAPTSEAVQIKYIAAVVPYIFALIYIRISKNICSTSLVGNIFGRIPNLRSLSAHRNHFQLYFQNKKIAFSYF